MGFDLKNLLIGSEGTLGIITSAILKTFPIPINPTSIFFSLKNLKDVAFVFEKITALFQEKILAETIHKFPFTLFEFRECQLTQYDRRHKLTSRCGTLNRTKTSTLTEKGKIQQKQHTQKVPWSLCLVAL